MGQIIGGAAKPKRCNLNKLSQLGTPAAGEYILVSSDNSMNAAGQGNFDCYIEGDGTKAATALPLIKTYANDVDNELTAGSDKLAKSGVVYNAVSQLEQKSIISSKRPIQYSDLTERGYYRSDNGNFSETPYARSAKFENLGYSTVIVRGDTNQQVYGVAMYDSNNRFLRGFTIANSDKQIFENCSDAAYIAVSMPYSDMAIAAFKCWFDDSLILKEIEGDNDTLKTITPLDGSGKIVFAGEIILNPDLRETSSTPATPTDDGGWDWQNAFLRTNGTLGYSKSEIQSRLISCLPGEIYQYHGKFTGGAGIGYYNSDKTWNRTIVANKIGSPVTDVTFTIPEGIYYFSVNCHANSISIFRLTKRAIVIDNVEYDREVGSSGVIKPGLNSFRFRFKKNFCNTSGTERVFSLGGLTPIHMNIDYAPPSSELFYQKENWWRESNIYLADFPMAKMQTRLRLYSTKNNENLSGSSGFELNDSPIRYRSLLRQRPPIIIAFNCPSGQEENYENLRLFITATDGVCDTLQIKDGDTIIYTKSFSSDTSVYSLYAALKTELAQISGYDFNVVFDDIENLAISDMVVTKPEGLPFITKFSSDCLTTGNIIYDAYPVFIEFQDNRVYELDIAYANGILRFYLDNTYLYVYDVIKGEVDSITFGENIEVLSSSYEHRKTLNCRSLIHGFTGHSLSNAPIGQTGLPNLHSPVGSVSMIADEAYNQGFVSMSVEEIGLSFIRGEKMPEKVFFIEEDDFATLQGFKDMLSDDNEDGIRVREILKKTGVKMGFAQEFSVDTTLFNKVKNGTATEDEKKQLSSAFTNQEILKMRSLMRSLDWTVSIHTFIGSVNPTTARYAEFKSAIRDTIWWYERMYEKSPLAHVTSGTGNSSPYYRRLMPMYGIPIVIQDYTIYSDGSFVPCLLRKSMGTLNTLPDVDYGIS